MTKTTAVITLSYDQEDDCGRCFMVLFVTTEEGYDELAHLQDPKQTRRRGARTMLIIHSNHGA